MAATWSSLPRPGRVLLTVFATLAARAAGVRVPHPGAPVAGVLAWFWECSPLK